MEKTEISFMDGPLVNKPEIPSSCGGHDVNSLYDCGKGKQFYETLKKEALFSPQHRGRRTGKQIGIGEEATAAAGNCSSAVTALGVFGGKKDD
jgi:hypothetical protein